MASVGALNAPAFEFETASYGPGALAVLEFHVEEAVSRPYVAEITLVARDAEHWDTGGGADRDRWVAHLEPLFALLRHRRNCRIFQNRTVPEIVTQLLDEGRVAHREILSDEYRPRAYCVQYRESDLDFVSRLLEEEGIFYWFEHELGEHTMVLADQVSSCQPITGDPRVPFREQSGLVAEEHLNAFLARRQLRPEKVTLRD